MDPELEFHNNKCTNYTSFKTVLKKKNVGTVQVPEMVNNNNNNKIKIIIIENCFSICIWSSELIKMNHLYPNNFLKVWKCVLCVHVVYFKEKKSQEFYILKTWRRCWSNFSCFVKTCGSPVSLFFWPLFTVFSCFWQKGCGPHWILNNFHLSFWQLVQLIALSSLLRNLSLPNKLRLSSIFCPLDVYAQLWWLHKIIYSLAYI